MTTRQEDRVTGPGGVDPSQALMTDQHGATFPTTASLVSAIHELRTDHTDEHRTIVLLAVSLSNAGEVVDRYGTRALELMTAEVARRTLQQDGRPARLLRASPLGGFLVALVVDRDFARTQVGAVLAGVRRLVAVGGEDVWPVVTAGARLLAEDDDTWDAVREVRTAVFTAGHHAIGDVVWHRDDDEAPLPTAFDLPLVRDLARTLEESPEQLGLHFQPVRDLRGGALMGAEALLRWTHPTYGAMHPGLTVEAAERTGLIVPLGRHVLRRGVAQLAGWLDEVGPDFRLHVNVSPLELRDPDYADHLEATLYHWGVPPQRLLLEVTETALVSDEVTVQQSLERISELGVALGIDDFGTGYSSIVHLRRLPIDTVKIDRSLVSGIATNPGDFTLARSVFQLVSSLGVMIIAEGIESALEASHLRAMGCRFGQGYHLGRPVPAADLLPRAGAIDESA